VTYHLDNTIAAIATAPGGAARSIVRVSGPAVAAIVESCFTADADGDTDRLQNAAAISGHVAVQLDRASRRLPCDLFCWPDRRSYTREPVAEFHVLGSPPLAQALLTTVCSAGARLAEPGEFTLRAFLAGRLDLTQAEAVLGVIDAHDAGDLRNAVEQLAGNLAKPMHRLREELLMLLAELEAGLDFVEEDIEFISTDAVVARLQMVADELAELAAQIDTRGMTTGSCQVVLVGLPNAGKSSLFNALVKRFETVVRQAEPAIVSHVSGTTRDYLVATVDLASRRCELIDTAGAGGSTLLVDEIDARAQERATERRGRALIRAVCIDASAAGLTDQIAGTSRESGELIVLTKADLAAPAVDCFAELPVVFTSSVNGRGLDEFAAAVTDQLASTTVGQRTACVAATADRCRESVRQAEAAVAHAAKLAETRAGDELVAAEIRNALAELGKVAGAVYTDDLLDRIFGAFCIGK
jgi:tRNA modification GTPase